MKLKIRHGNLFPTESTHIRADFLLFDHLHRRWRRRRDFFFDRFDLFSLHFFRLFDFEDGKRSKLLVQLRFNDEFLLLLLHDDLPLLARSFTVVFQIEFLSELNEKRSVEMNRRSYLMNVTTAERRKTVFELQFGLSRIFEKGVDPLIENVR